jgi:hypothetical protein
MESKFFFTGFMTEHLGHDRVKAAAKGYLNTPVVEHLLSCDECCQAIEAQKVVIGDKLATRDASC